ncbi:hypothetical protein BDZ89DRAFT_973069 [Hymenopellis radicata]|nr:hypothetical protein BDZ89DRAFT_973069 [Hymenopellis radicata]
MPPRGVLWPYFHRGEPQNRSQFHAHCLAHIDVQRPNGIPINVDELLQAQPWFNEATREHGSCRGDATAMAHHLLNCPHASIAARKVAQGEKDRLDSLKKKDRHGAMVEESDADDEAGGAPAKKKCKRLEKTKDTLRQTHLKVFKGINIPFPSKEKTAIQAQFLRATISANLPFRWTDDPEIIKLFLMMRATADDVIPERRVLSGRLLEDAAEQADHNIRSFAEGNYVSASSDGWKDNSRNSVTGVHIARRGMSKLIKLIKTNKQNKDGESYCTFFLAVIDDLESETGCLVVLFCTDNDGGSHKGRDLMPIKRPWLFVAPCCGHQFQLILGDYFKENDTAAEFAEQATGLIGWLLNHQKVRSIFDDVQQLMNNTVLTFIVANLTRWTTHLLAFDRLILLKACLRNAVVLHRDALIKAQVGKETGRKAAVLTAAAEEQIDLIDDNNFWKGIEGVVQDIEPICYGTNINQSDHTRLDEVTLTFAGIYRYFDGHKTRSVAAGMKKRIEKRWKALDQPLFIFALILNPYEKLSRFGDDAEVNVFALNSAFMELYKRAKLRPDESMSSDELAAQRSQKEVEVSKAFMAYLADRGAFSHWKEHHPLIPLFA